MTYAVKPSQLLTWDARRSRRLIDAALNRAGVDPIGMRFRVSSRIGAPYAVGNTVYIPSALVDEPDLFVDCVAHEARHVEVARDSRYDELKREDHEAEARQAGRRAKTGGWPAKAVVPRLTR